MKPGGVLLVTFSDVSQVARYDMERRGKYLRFTTFRVVSSAPKFFLRGFPGGGLDGA
jgi:hypothetical protein